MAWQSDTVPPPSGPVVYLANVDTIAEARNYACGGYRAGFNGVPGTYIGYKNTTGIPHLNWDFALAEYARAYQQSTSGFSWGTVKTTLTEANRLADVAAASEKAPVPTVSEMAGRGEPTVVQYSGNTSRTGPVTYVAPKSAKSTPKDDYQPRVDYSKNPTTGNTVMTFLDPLEVVGRLPPSKPDPTPPIVAPLVPQPPPVVAQAGTSWGLIAAIAALLLGIVG